MPRAEELSFGLKRNSQGLPSFVKLGSVPPNITGLASFMTSGAMAWTWGERIEPRNPTMSDCAASLENASTMPGLVVWSSSTINSSCLPSTPPFLLTASSASLAPPVAYLPASAAGPVIGAHMPILMVAPCARALPMMWGAAIPAAMPAAKSRLGSFICLSLRPGLLCRPFLFLQSRGRENVRVSKDSRVQSKLQSHRLRLTEQNNAGREDYRTI